MSQTKISRVTKIKLLNRINLSSQVFDKKPAELSRIFADALERVKKAKSVKYSPSGQSVQQYIDSKNAGTGTAWFSTSAEGSPAWGNGASNYVIKSWRANVRSLKNPDL